jgi:hypothetical protein
VSIVIAALAAAFACGPEPDAITVERDRISVFNRTAESWRDLELRVNRYYVVTIARLAAGGRFDAPVMRLQGGFGRYFDPGRERVRSVEVRGTSQRGGTVTIVWQEGRVVTSDLPR